MSKDSRTHRADPILEVVIVTATGCRGFLDACLGSLDTNRPRHGHMVVHIVDNDSQDGTATYVSSAYPCAHLVPLGYNAGFSAANNIILREVSSPFVLLLNPDTEMHPEVLDGLLERMCSDQCIGVLGCRLIGADGAPDSNAKRSIPNPGQALAYFALTAFSSKGVRRSAYTTPGLGFEDVGDVDSVSGAFMLLRTEAMREVGLLDEGYWMYGEDMDWCHRFRLRGWKVVYDGTRTVLHIKGGAAGTYRRPRQNVAFHQSMGRFYRKFQAGRCPLLDISVYGAIAARLVVSLLHSGWARSRS